MNDTIDSQTDRCRDVDSVINVYCSGVWMTNTADDATLRVRLSNIIV
jgi:hypothetical protein